MNFVAKLMKKRWGHQTKVNIDFHGTQGVVLLALDGWDLSKYENREGGPNQWNHSTKGLQFRFSMNGPIKMTYREWREFVDRIDVEWVRLNNIENPTNTI